MSLEVTPLGVDPDDKDASDAEKDTTSDYFIEGLQKTFQVELFYSDGSSKILSEVEVDELMDWESNSSGTAELTISETKAATLTWEGYGDVTLHARHKPTSITNFQYINAYSDITITQKVLESIRVELRQDTLIDCPEAGVSRSILVIGCIMNLRVVGTFNNGLDEDLSEDPDVIWKVENDNTADLAERAVFIDAANYDSYLNDPSHDYSTTKTAVDQIIGQKGLLFGNSSGPVVVSAVKGDIGENMNNLTVVYRSLKELHVGEVAGQNCDTTQKTFNIDEAEEISLCVRGIYDNNEDLDMTGSVSWSVVSDVSSDPSNDSVVFPDSSPAGTMKGVKPVSLARIKVSYNNISNEVEPTVGVNIKKLMAITILPEKTSYNLASEIPFTAEASYDNGQILPLEGVDVVWTSLDSSILEFFNDASHDNGTAKTNDNEGDVQITVTDTASGVFATKLLSISNNPKPTDTGLAATSQNVTIMKGGRLKLDLIALLSNNTMKNIPEKYTWLESSVEKGGCVQWEASSDLLTVENNQPCLTNDTGINGTIQANVENTGVAEVWAVLPIDSTADVTWPIDPSSELYYSLKFDVNVVEEKLHSIIINPNGVDIKAGNSIKLTVTGIYDSNRNVDITDQVNWTFDSSPDATTDYVEGTIDGGVVIVKVDAPSGTVELGARLDGKSGTVEIDIIP